MCGIFGFSLHSSSKNSCEQLINQFRKSLYYRGPDSFNYFSNLNCYIGISRLSIVDINNESQPFFLKEENITVVFNGEIYNYKSLRKKLIKKGINIIGFSEVEVIANLYLLYAERFVNHLDGMFSIAIFKHDCSSFLLFRDPYGIKPLYWTYEKGDFAFSSNLTSLIKTFSNSSCNINAVQEYLFHGYCSSNANIISDIHKLPPSSFLSFSNNLIKINSYQSFLDLKNIEDPSRLDIDHLDYLLQESVSEQIADEVPMGIMLSGGLDSSLLAYYLSVNKRFLPKTKSYSIRFADKESSIDFIYAKKLANNLSLDHQIINLNSEDSIASLQKAADNLDEPISDTGIIGTNAICEQASKDGLKVLLSGTGADELFAGYFRHYKSSFFTSNSLSRLHPGFRAVTSLFGSFLSGPSLGMRLSDPLSNYFLSVSGMPGDLVTLLLDNPVRRKPYFSKYLKNLPTNYSLFLDQRYYLPDSLLAYTDKISMAHSLEVRVPYLCKSLSPLLFLYINNIPKLDKTKPILRKLASRYFSSDFINRPKEGFDASVYSWPDSMISYLLEYIFDYSNELQNLGIDITRLHQYRYQNSNASLRNLVFSLYILTRWKVNHIS
tara:strand:- start:4855 stop:6675 length:1821 start_codon:yes stop_codon:yes gene_type:complete